MAITEAAENLDLEELDRASHLSVVGDSRVPKIGEAAMQAAEADTVPINKYDQFIEGAAKTLKALGIFTVRHEITQVRLMTGDVIGNDYPEAIFRVEKPSSNPEEIKARRSERLLAVVTTSAVHEKEASRFKEGNFSPTGPTLTPEQIEERREIQENNGTVRAIVDDAISLLFELWSELPDDEIKKKIRDYIMPLDKIEVHMSKYVEIISGAVPVKNDDEAKLVKERINRSHHRHVMLQAILWRLGIND